MASRSHERAGQAAHTSSVLAFLRHIAQTMSVHNTFITRQFDWDGRPESTAVRAANRALRMIGTRLRAPRPAAPTSTVEQRINIYHFVSQLIAHDVQGDLIDVGSFVGETAALITTVLEGEGSLDRRLHVYDAFEPSPNTPEPLAVLQQNFEQHQLPLPEIHRGRLEETIPDELPNEISFVHLNCPWAGDPTKHEHLLRELMGHIYLRMTHGSICSIADYTDSDQLPGATNAQPAVKLAFDKFMADKPERISVLYAGELGHAYFRKL
ncbi:MAG TPA: TylF/MycF/NovP-related O-methyltransferase [Polyangiales bacterium]